jgi:hypothetical protein
LDPYFLFPMTSFSYQAMYSISPSLYDLSLSFHRYYIIIPLSSW